MTHISGRLTPPDSPEERADNFMKTSLLRLVAALSLCSILGIASAQAQKVDKADWMTKIPASDESAPTGIRTVLANARELIPIAAKLRYTTVVILPDEDEIMD